MSNPLSTPPAQGQGIVASTEPTVQVAENPASTAPDGSNDPDSYFPDREMPSVAPNAKSLVEQHPGSPSRSAGQEMQAAAQSSNAAPAVEMEKKESSGRKMLRRMLPGNAAAQEREREREKERERERERERGSNSSSNPVSPQSGIMENRKDVRAPNALGEAVDI